MELAGFTLISESYISKYSLSIIMFIPPIDNMFQNISLLEVTD